MNRSRLLLAALALTGLLSCAPVAEHRAGFFVFGTLLEVVLRDTAAEQAQDAFADIQQALQTMHREWHAWAPGALTSVNTAFSEGRGATAPSDIIQLVRLSQEIEMRSGGRFNAAAGGLVRMWGFHTSEFPVTSPPPDDEALAEWLNAAPSASDIRIEEGRLYSRNTAVQLDFGGIAKGFAVDRIIGMLARAGIAHAMVNAGGDLRAVGASTDVPWRVGIREPGGGVVAGIRIADAAAVFTSGVDQRFRELEGKRYPHILDPRTGQPVQGLASVTVVAAEGWLADAAATALMVAGPAQWPEVAAALGLDQVLVIDAEGRYFATPAMAGMLEWAKDSPKPNLTLVAPARGRPGSDS